MSYLIRCLSSRISGATEATASHFLQDLFHFRSHLIPQDQQKQHSWCWTTAGTTFRDLGTRTRQSCQNMIVLHCSWLFVFHPAPEFPGIPKDQFRPAQAARRQPFCWPSPDLLVPGHSLLVKSDTNNLHETCTSLSHSQEILVARLWRILKSIREISSSPSAALLWQYKQLQTQSYILKHTRTPGSMYYSCIILYDFYWKCQQQILLLIHQLTSSFYTTAAEHQVHMHFHLEKANSANSAHGWKLPLRSLGENLQPDGWVCWFCHVGHNLQLWNRHFTL